MFKLSQLGVHLGALKKLKVATKTISIKDTGKSSSRKLRRVTYYTLYRMDPQKTCYKNSCCAKIANIKIQNINISKLQIFKLHDPASILKYQKNLKLRQKQFHMKDTGKSSSRKLRYVIYYTLYRMDPQKTY